MTRTLFIAFLASGFSVASAATPIMHLGTDAGTSTIQSDLAYQSWIDAVGGDFTLDNLDGLSGNPGFGGSLTSDLGNTFSSSDDLVSTLNFSFAVLDGISLRLSQVGAATDFIWQAPNPMTSFGFFSRNNDGGTVTVELDDGSMQVFSFSAESSAGTGDNFFFGLSDLNAMISQVTVTSTDPGTGSNGGNSNWDRFVYTTAVVPEPATAALTGLGVFLLMLCSRGRRTKVIPIDHG